MRRFAWISVLSVALGLSPAGAAFAADAPARDQSKAPDAEPGAEDRQALDHLYERLAKTRFPEEAEGILSAIEHARMQSGSDAADLLLSRALQARASADLPLALQLFDAVIYLYPDWSEAWSERATARFQSGDVAGAMGDLAQTLKREPRDVGALAGLGAILLDAGNPEAALRVYDRALALAPAYEPLTEARARAQTELWSRSP